MRADKGTGVPAKPADDLPPPPAPPATPQNAIGIDPKADGTAAMVAFQFESHGAKLNAVVYKAAGPGPHSATR